MLHLPYDFFFLLLFFFPQQGDIEVCVKYDYHHGDAVEKDYLVLLDKLQITWDAILQRKLENLLAEFIPTNQTSNKTSSETESETSKQTRTKFTIKSPSIIVRTRFPDLRPGALKDSLRKEALNIDIFQPKLQTVIFSDQSWMSFIGSLLLEYC